MEEQVGVYAPGKAKITTLFLLNIFWVDKSSHLNGLFPFIFSSLTLVLKFTLGTVEPTFFFKHVFLISIDEILDLL